MNYTVERIKPEHDKKICKIIKNVGQEYGAIGEGFGPSDPEVKAMSKYYDDKNSKRYLVASIDGKIVGGGGIAPFSESTDVCELKKLFLSPEGRGLGIGRKLTDECLSYAKRKGYKKCYLDTLKVMASAISLYEKMGFEHLEHPLEGTIHNKCDVWMIKEL